MGGRLRFQARRADITLSQRKVKALLIGALVALSVGCGGTGDRSEARSSLPVLASVAADPLPAEAVVASRSWSAAEATGAATPTRAAEATLGVASASSDGSAAASAPEGQTAKLQAVQERGEATTSGATATVEELLEDGLYGAGASPVHLAIRGTPAAGSVRCDWRGIARTAAQREDAIRFWLRLDATEAMPSVGALEVLFAVVLDALDPYLRETAKANFRAIARGGESLEYLFLTCFADYAVTAFLLGSGTTPATVTVAYDRRGEAASYDLYVREHEAGTYGSDPLQTRGAYEAGLQAQVVAAEKELSAAIGGREAVVFLAPMGAHNAIGFEAWQAVAQWAVVTDDAGVVQAVRDDTPAGDPEHTQPLANLSSRISTAATTDAHATTRVTTVGGLQPYYRDTLQAYADITPGDGQTTTFTPKQPPAAPTCTNGTVIPNPADNRELVKDCETLLAVGHTLRGSAALNWSTGTALTSWTGVTTGGTPTRVTGLRLANQSLSGRIPADIGHLFALTTLNLSSNSLTGEIPTELDWLDQLTELRLSGNALTGCIPLTLRSVATNDLASLTLPFCAPPPPTNLQAGTPTATSVVVSWDAVAEAGAYRVEVRESPLGTWTTHSDTITGTSHTVDELVCQTAYEVRVRVRGSGTTYGKDWSDPSTAVTATTGACSPPVFAEAGYAFSAAEDVEAGVQVGTVQATVDSGQPVTHALTAGNQDEVWALDATSGELKLVGMLDYETTPIYTLTVTADGGAGGTATTTVTVTVTNVDEPPAFEAESYAISVAEDAAINTTVGTVTANDPEGGTVVYDITAGNEGGPWAVDALAGTLVLGARLDYETTAAYTLTVRALVLGGGPAAGTTTVTVTVTDVADAPPAPTNVVATPAPTSLALSWGAVADASKYQVDSRTSGAEAWTTAANDVTTTTYTLADLTCGTAYEVQVRAFGSVGSAPATWSAPSATLAATTSTCPPPAFGAETYSFSVAENSAAGTAVGTVTATTTGAGPVTYALTAGNEAGAFALDAGTGAITVTGALDYETTPSYPVTVTANDGQGGTSTAAVTITVTNVDEAPGFGAADYAFSVAEDAAAGTAVGTVGATDPEGGAVSYAIAAGNEAGAFALDASSGALTVAGTLDYETADKYSLTVSARDAAGHTGTADIEIAVTDVAYAPTFGAASYAWSVAEDAAVGAALGTVSATDPEGGAVSYKITAGNDAGALAMDAASGALTVAGTLDHETTTSYSLTVQASSSGGAATATAPVTVTVTNVDEAPVFGAGSYSFSVAENVQLATTIGTVTATDPEGGTVVYDITAGNEALTWAVDALKGGVVVGARLNHAATPSYSLTVRAGALEGGPSATVTVTITVTSAG